MTYTETDFFLRQREADRGWRQPLVLAMALHLFAFFGTAIVPDLFNRRPILDDVVTVNLVSMPEIAPPRQEAPPRPARPEPPPKAEPEPVKVEPAKAKVAVAPEPVAEETPAPVKPVSLTPIKRKVQKTDPAKIAAEKARKEQEQQRQQELARAEMEEERARQEAERARAALAEMIRQKGTRSSATSASRSSSGRKEVQSLVFKQYLSSLYDRVQQHWLLPDMRRWDDSLETVVVLTIRRDGSVVKTEIEKKASDPFFDQFVLKTIQNALPMPPFPTLMTEGSIEVGLRFRPGELLM